MWTVEPKKLVEVLEILNLVPARSGLPSSSFVKLQGGKSTLSMSLTAEASGMVHIKGDGQLELSKPIYLDRALLFAFVFTAKDYRSEKPFTFSVGKDQLLVSQGKRKATLQFATAGSGYADDESDSGDEIPLSEELSELLKVSLSCATLEPMPPELNAVYLQQNGSYLELFSSNQMVVFYARRKEKTKFPDSLAFPVHLVPFLDAKGLQSVHVRQKDVALQFECGHIWHPIPVKAQKSFPVSTMEDLVKGEHKEWPEHFRLPVHRLGRIVGRFSAYFASAKKEDWIIKVSAEQGKSYVVFESAIPQAEFREQASVEDAIMSDFAIDWPLDLLLPAFEHLAKDKESVLSVRFGKKTPYLLDAGNVRLVVSMRK